MSKRLTANINSRYVEAADALRPAREGKKKRRIVAYVESYDDVFFWRDVLSEFESDELEFQVMLPSRTNLARGKKQAMTNALGEQLGKSMIACVDADYDYLLQGHTPYSEAMLTNRYIFHTYAYAIENFQCYAPSLREVCVMSTLNDRRVFDFERYLRSYSQAVYPLFLWTVWLYRQSRFGEFPLNQFLQTISIHRLNTQQPDQAIAQVRSAVQRKVNWLKHKNPTAEQEFPALEEELQQLGVSPDDTYLYIQGHHLMDNVVMTALDPICTLLRREREKEIKRLARGHTQQLDNELASYMHSQCDVGQMLRRNTAYKQSPPYQLLRQHIRCFLGLKDEGSVTSC